MESDNPLTHPSNILHGDVLGSSLWREQWGRFGVGDFVTRDGTNVHRVISLDGPGADMGEFLCVVEPARWEDNDPWIRPGEIESNLTRRYAPFEAPSAFASEGDPRHLQITRLMAERA